MSKLASMAFAALTLALAACGASGGSTAPGDPSERRAAACPPERKGDGLLVNQRYDMEDILAAQQWREDIPPASCAGSLARYVPEFPESYGLAPDSKPYVMNSDQVYLSVGELPDELLNEYGTANLPQGYPLLFVELVRFSDEEIAKARQWMAENPDGYKTYDIDGREAYLMSGLAIMRPGKGDRIGTSLIGFPEGNIVAKVAHQAIMQRDEVGLRPGHIAYETMSDILDSAG